MSAIDVAGAAGSADSNGTSLRIDERAGAVLAEHAAWNEEHRRLSERSLAALRDSGALRLLVPARVGGDELTFADMVANVREAALYDGAAAWVLMVLVGHSWMLGSMSEDLQDEVYGADLDTIVPGSLAPSGRPPRPTAAGSSTAAGRSPAARSGATGSCWAPRCWSPASDPA